MASYIAIKSGVVDLSITIRMNQFFKYFSRLPATEEELYLPSDKPVTYISEVSDNGAKGFTLLSKHFPNSWGFMWQVKRNSFTRKLLALSKNQREDVYCQLASREFTTKLRQQFDDPLTDGLLSVAGEEGKIVISEAYKYLGVPPLVSYKSDLILMDLPHKVPLSWIQKAAPLAFNVHPAPPEKRGAGVYVPDIIAKENTYGVTVHILNEKLDDGAILFVKRFSIPDGCTRTRLRDLTANISYNALEELALNMKYMDSIADVRTTCHLMWGADEITRSDVRRMIEQLICEYGKKGHPALL